MENALHKRNSALDICRIFATFAVIMIHCSTRFVSYGISTPEFLVGNIFDSISRLGVPFFLMIAGSLFLNEERNYTIKGIFSKNIKNIAIITLVWGAIYSLIYNVVFVIRDGKEVEVKDVIIDTLEGHYHMWYLYMTIGLYIITPFLRSFVSKQNKKMVLLFIAMAIISQFSNTIINILAKYEPIFKELNVWIDNFYLEFFGCFITYFIVGWYIVNVGFSKKCRCLIYFLGLLSITTMIIYTQLTKDYKNTYINEGLLDFLYSSSVFLAINNLKLKLKENHIKLLASASKLTFGIYIVHALVLSVCQGYFKYNNSRPALYVLALWGMVFAISLIISFILSKIPLIKTIIKA